MEVAPIYIPQPSLTPIPDLHLIKSSHTYNPMDTTPMMQEERPNINMTNMMDSSPDILLGAYLMSHLRNACENCSTTYTPQWRKGWYSEILNRSVLLCNACGIKWAKKQFCPYCNYIYGKEVDRQSDAWLVCTSCSRWVHFDCEKRHREESHMQEDGKSHNMSHLYSHYLCPSCNVGASVPAHEEKSAHMKKPRLPADMM